MTVGLIRSETASDLRTLTATGAGWRTRRALTGVTAGVIALSARAGHGGRVPGLARVGARGLTQTFGNVPWADIGLLVVGMPLVGAAAGGLLGGGAVRRGPSALE